jgi:probable F420-dependent oxidoreductase
MDLGFAVPVSGSWATPDNQVHVAQRAEQLGYRSIWTFQRLLYPVKPESDRWAQVYRSVTDPLVTLAFLAGQTTSVELGVAILNAPFYSPILLAKQVASLDIVSNGRAVVGVGLGWSTEEFAAAGADMSGRGKRMEDFLACLDAILSADGPVDYHGSHYVVPNAYVEPRPVQRPRPPIIVGGVADAALDRAGRLADGWVSASRADLANVGTSIEKVRNGARAAGKDPAALRFVCRGVVRVRDERAGVLSGSYDEIRADLDALAEAGMTEVFVDLNFDEQIGAVDADPKESLRRADEVLEALAPS